jgi:hypothetical protein
MTVSTSPRADAVSDAVPLDATAPDALRDALTRSRLAGQVAHLIGLEEVGFDRNWWDGQSHSPCLVVRGGRGHRTWRVVETGGDAVVVPFERRAAGRWLAERRRPVPIELGVPAPRRAPDHLIVDATGDVVRCAAAGCGALLPVGYDGACPVCGAADSEVGALGAGAAGASEEKSTATGARTAASSTSK